MNILGIGQDKSQSQYFTEGHMEPKYETERGQGPATPPGHVARPGPRQGVVWHPSTPSTSPSAYKMPSGRKP